MTNLENQTGQGKGQKMEKSLINKGKGRDSKSTKKEEKKSILWSDTAVDHKIMFKFSKFSGKLMNVVAEYYNCKTKYCNLYYFKLSSKERRNCVGSSVPLLCFIACPTRNARAFVLPFL